MIFSEIYSAYYSAVSEIIKAALDHPVSIDEIRKLSVEHAFAESAMAIEEALTEEKWQLIKADGITPLRNEPYMPLTTIERRWLKAIMLDPRIRLFVDEPYEDDGVEALFTPKDYYIFDKYADGDDFSDENYIRNFRLVLDAIKRKYPLSIEVLTRTGKPMHMDILPKFLEYSEKDDKFRVYGPGIRFGAAINLGRIISCRKSENVDVASFAKPVRERPRRVIFELTDERKALERAMMHFAHFEKQVERKGDKKYTVTIDYDKSDETELVIRVLSFGPMLRVVQPVHFINLIKDRLRQQKSCGL